MIYNIYNTIISYIYSGNCNECKKKINFCSAAGFYNALLGKNSWYRPNIDD